MPGYLNMLNHFMAFCFLTYFSSRSTCFPNSANGSWYESPANIPHGPSMPPSSSHQASSNVECANICAQDPSCLVFKYEKSANVCNTSCTGMPNTDGSVYGVEMSTEPVSDGYTLYKPWNISLKYHDVRKTQADAEDFCQNEGGHLVLILDASMHCLVKSILKSLKSDGASSPYVDGRRDQNGDKFMSRENKPLPFTRWTVNEPDPGNDKCIRLSRTNDYDFSDDDCTDEKRFMCQK